SVLLVQGLGKNARDRREIVPFSYLLERLVVASELRLGRLRISRDQLDGPRVERRQGRVQPHTELVQHRSASSIEIPGSIEVAAHRLRMRQVKQGHGFRLAVSGRGFQDLLTSLDGLGYRRRPPDGTRRERGEVSNLEGPTAGRPSVFDRALRRR